MSGSSSDSLSGTQLSLTNHDQWTPFPAPMEMIVHSKTGRKMFPHLEYSIQGLDASKMYEVSLHMEQVDDVRYTYNEKWEEASKGWTIPPVQRIKHESGMRSGDFWMAHPVSFEYIRLTNNSELDRENHFYLKSMHLYQPVVIFQEIGGTEGFKEFRFDVTQFMAVTTYKNKKIVDMKCATNKFCGPYRSLKRKMASDLDETSGAKKVPTIPSTPENHHGPGAPFAINPYQNWLTLRSMGPTPQFGQVYPPTYNQTWYMGPSMQVGPPVGPTHIQIRYMGPSMNPINHWGPISRVNLSLYWTPSWTPTVFVSGPVP